MYKVKSQDPSKYIVKPHMGKVQPHSVVKVIFTLKAVQVDYVASLRDKFVVVVKQLPSHLAEVPDLRQLWNLCGKDIVYQAELECHFDRRTPPPGIDISYEPITESSQGATRTEQSTASLAAAPNEVSSAPAPRQRVTFDEKDPTLGERSLQAPSVSQTPSNSVENALVNAQRMRQRMEADVARLEETARKLTSEVEASRATIEQYETKARSLADLTHANTVTEAAVHAKSTALAAAVPPAPTVADSPSTVTPVLQSTTTEQPTVNTAPLTPKPKGKGGMFLSTVLLWMFVLYALGMGYRWLALNGNVVPLWNALPSSIQSSLLHAQSALDAVHQVTMSHVGMVVQLVHPSFVSGSHTSDGAASAGAVPPPNNL